MAERMNASAADRAGRVRIRPATAGDLGPVSELLSAAGLVAIDETAQFGPQYAVAEDENGAVVGVAGYERYGDTILLRSVTVAETARSAGIGARLTEDRLEHACGGGCTKAFLLTDTARGYWERHGFEAIERSAAPDSIQSSSEWRHACPASATAMARRIGSFAGLSGETVSS